MQSIDEIVTDEMVEAAIATYWDTTNDPEGERDMRAVLKAALSAIDLNKVRRETWEEAARVAEKHGDTWTGTRDVMCAAQEAAVDEKCLEIAAALRARATAKGGQTDG